MPKRSPSGRVGKPTAGGKSGTSSTCDFGKLSEADLAAILLSDTDGIYALRLEYLKAVESLGRQGLESLPRSAHRAYRTLPQAERAVLSAILDKHSERPDRLRAELVAAYTDHFSGKSRLDGNKLPSEYRASVGMEPGVTSRRDIPPEQRAKYYAERKLYEVGFKEFPSLGAFRRPLAAQSSRLVFAFVQNAAGQCPPQDLSAVSTLSSLLRAQGASLRKLLDVGEHLWPDAATSPVPAAWEGEVERQRKNIQEMTSSTGPGQIKLRAAAPPSHGHQPGQESERTGRAKGKSRVKRDEANLRAREHLKEQKHRIEAVTAREVARKVGCALGLVSKLPAWRAVQEKRGKARRPKTPMAVSLTPKMQATIGQSNDAPESSSKESEDHQAEMKATADESAATLQQLVNDQKKDQDGDWTPDPNQTKEQRERGLQWTSPKVGPRRRQA